MLSPAFSPYRSLVLIHRFFHPSLHLGPTLKRQSTFSSGQTFSPTISSLAQHIDPLPLASTNTSRSPLIKNRPLVKRTYYSAIWPVTSHRGHKCQAQGTPAPQIAPTRTKRLAQGRNLGHGVSLPTAPPVQDLLHGNRAFRGCTAALQTGQSALTIHRCLPLTNIPSACRQPLLGSRFLFLRPPGLFPSTKIKIPANLLRLQPFSCAHASPSSRHRPAVLVADNTSINTHRTTARNHRPPVSLLSAFGIPPFSSSKPVRPNIDPPPLKTASVGTLPEIQAPKVNAPSRTRCLSPTQAGRHTETSRPQRAISYAIDISTGPAQLNFSAKPTPKGVQVSDLHRFVR